MAQRTDCELSSMGILSIEKKGLTVDDVVLVKQGVSAAHVDLDMEWWAYLILDFRFWILDWKTGKTVAFPATGVERPSSTDEETMRESFGAWDLGPSGGSRSFALRAAAAVAPS